LKLHSSQTRGSWRGCSSLVNLAFRYLCRKFLETLHLSFLYDIGEFPQAAHVFLCQSVEVQLLQVLASNRQIPDFVQNDGATCCLSVREHAYQPLIWGW
jgi:hypothetical protein